MERIIVRVRGAVSRKNPYRDLEVIVQRSDHWLSLPSTLSRELGIATTPIDQVVAPSGEAIDCEIGVAFIEVPGRLGATLVRRINDIEPRIGWIALGALGIKIDQQTGELALGAPVCLVRARQRV